MKHLFIKINAVILLLLAFLFQCMGADKYTLEYNLEKGKTYKQNMVMDMNMTMDMMGQEMKMNMKMDINMDYNVIEKNGNVYDIQLSYKKMKMSMTDPMPFNVDSDSPEQSSDKSLGDMLKSFTGIPINVQMNQQGKVLSIKDADKLTEKLNATNDQFKQMFGQQFSEQMIQRSIEQSSSLFPGKPVAINYTWDIATSINNNGFDIISKMNLTLKQVKDNVATIEFTGTLSTPEGGTVANIQGMDAKVMVKGGQSGTILMDTKTGWIVRSEITQDFTQEIEIMGQTMPQKIVSKITVTDK